MEPRTAETLSSLGLRFAVSPLSWTNDVLHDLGDDTPSERVMADAAEAGFQGVELGRKFPRDPAVLGPLLKQYDLGLAGGWYSGFLAERDVATEMKAVDAHANLLAEMSSAVMVYGECGLMPGEAPLDAPLSATPSVAGDDWGAYGERVTEFADTVWKRYGVRTAYHPHLMMAVENASEIDRFMAVTGRSVGLLLDTGHVWAAGDRVERIIERYGDRINHIHLKDVRSPILEAVRREDRSFNAGVRAGMFAAPGQGDRDFTATVGFAASAAYRGWIVVEAEQDPEKAPPRETITVAYDHIMRLVGRGDSHD